jgi:biotin carboxyl carrier protein
MRRYTIKVNGREMVVDVDERGADRFEVDLDGRRFQVSVTSDVDLNEASITPAIEASAPDAPAAASRESAPVREKLAPIPARPGPPAASSTSLITAPMPGVIVSIDVAEGAQVTRGQSLVSLEAMKMRNAIRSPRDGVVVAVHVQNGQSVAHGEPLVDVKERRP